MPTGQRIAFLEGIYFPAVDALDQSDAEKFAGLANGRNSIGLSREVDLKGGFSQRATITESQALMEGLAIGGLKLTSPNELWLRSATRCLEENQVQNSVRERQGEGWSSDFCGDGPESSASSTDFCSNHSENFLNQWGASRVINREEFPAKGPFDQRVSNSQSMKPALQGFSKACVGMALADELNHAAQPIFVGSAQQSFDGFQLYRQYGIGGDGDRACGEIAPLNNFSKSLEMSEGLYVPSLRQALKTRSPCLELSHNRLSVGKVSMLVTDAEEGPPDFSFFERLVQAGQGAIAFIDTEIALEQEDWVHYGCKSEIGHAVYLLGVGRGLNPFTNKPEEYVVVRDSLRGVSREYKVPIGNFRSRLIGLMKVGDLTYQDGEMIRSQIEKSTSPSRPSAPQVPSATSR